MLQRARHHPDADEARADSPWVAEIVVVDDGSTDGTAEIARRRSTTRGSDVVRQTRNQGKGAALRRGFAAGHRRVRHRAGRRPRVRPRRVRRSSSHRCSRARPTSCSAPGSCPASPHRVLYFWHSVGNRLLTLLSNMFTDLNLTDMETCYKVFRREVIQSVDDRGGPLRLRAGDHGQGGAAAAGGSTRSGSPTAAARTPRARRSASATAFAPSTASCATPGSATAFVADDAVHR